MDLDFFCGRLQVNGWRNKALFRPHGHNVHHRIIDCGIRHYKDRRVQELRIGSLLFSQLFDLNLIRVESQVNVNRAQAQSQITLNSFVTLLAVIHSQQRIVTSV
jgi:hypothetical protein